MKTNRIQAFLVSNGASCMLNLKTRTEVPPQECVRLIKEHYGLDMNLSWIKYNGTYIMIGGKMLK